VHNPTRTRFRRLLGGVAYFVRIVIVQLVIWFTWAIVLDAWDASYRAGWMR
jgi:TRAP-type C4-dicarboxylate transport system permease small subunit